MLDLLNLINSVLDHLLQICLCLNDLILHTEKKTDAFISQICFTFSDRKSYLVIYIYNISRPQEFKIVFFNHILFKSNILKGKLYLKKPDKINF